MDIKSLLNVDMVITDGISLEKGNESCHVCHRVFDGLNPKRTLNRHLRSVHEERIECVYCSKKIKVKGRPDHYKGHLKRCSVFMHIVKDMSILEREAQFDRFMRQIKNQK